MITLASWILTTTVKGALLIVLVAAIDRLFGRHFDVRWRHLLWVLVLVRLLLPVAPPASWSLFSLLPSTDQLTPAVARSAPELLPVAVAAAEPEPLVLERSGGLEIVRWAAGVWLAVALLLVLRLLVAALRTGRAVSRAIRRALPKTALQQVVDEARRELGIDRPVRIVECGAVRTPALHGVLRPVILLPIGTAESFTRAELRHVILHELWHLRRGDVVVSWLLAAAEALHWFNPLVWFAAARIREERELACDELALSLLEEEERTGYGMTILKLLERFRAPAPIPLLVGIVNHKQKMKRRLMMIASFRNRTRFSVFLFLAVTGVAVAGLTDAPERRLVKRIDPVAIATIERLDQRVSLELRDATFGEVVAKVASESGLPVLQAPELATHEIQQARFTIRAENVPLLAVVMEALMPFRLTATPDAAGLTIEPGDTRRVLIQRSDVAGNDEKVIIRRHRGSAGDEPVLHAPDGEGKQVRSIRIKKHAEENAIATDGKHVRELIIKSDVDGVKSEGKLTIEITK